MSHLHLILRFIGLSVVLGLASAAQPPSAAEALEYRMFVGVDVEAREGGETMQVTDFKNHLLHLKKEDGKSLNLRSTDEMKFVHSIKIGRAPVQVADITTEVFVDNAAERMEVLRNQTALQAYGAQREDIEWGQTVREMELQTAVANSPQLQNPVQVQANFDGPILPPAIDNSALLPDQLTDPTFYSDSLADDITKKPDALRIEADLRTDRPIRHAYVVAIVHVRDPEGEINVVLVFKEVALINHQPRPIVLEKTGLPEGYELVDVRLHLFDEGTELPTSESEKQIALSREQAISYLGFMSTQREGAKRGGALPPEPVWSLAPDALVSADRPAQLDCPVTVQVDASGQVTGMEANGRALPPVVSDIVGEMLFYPALENGVAVAGTTEINLREYFR